MTPGYRLWVTRMHDHAQMCNPGWRKVLDFARSRKHRLNFDVLRQITIDGLGPADVMMLAQDLYTFIGTVMTETWRSLF